MLMKVLLVHNENAGEGELDSAAITRLIEKAGHSVRTVPKEDNGLERRLGESLDLVAVAGGDGSVTKVATAMVGEDTPLTILPMGTANNLAHSVGITGDPADLIAGWEQGASVPLDAARVKHPRGEVIVFESAGIGIFTEAMCLALSHRNSAEKFSAEERFDRDFRLLRQLAQTVPSIRCVIEIDGKESEETVLLCEIMNSRQIGSRLVLAPTAETGDGLLDLVTVNDGQRPLLHRFLHRDPSDDQPPHLPVRQGRRIRITSKVRRIHLADTIERFMSGNKPWTLEATVEPGAVQLLVPAM
jgi:diacylglycerol kinase (ATP)